MPVESSNFLVCGQNLVNLINFFEGGLLCVEKFFFSFVFLRLGVVQMTNENTPISRILSSEIVKYLRTGRKLKEISELAGLSESFISHIGKGERAFKLEHLLKLEKALGEPLPLLLLKATDADSLTEEMRELYQPLHEFLEGSSRLRTKHLKSR